MKKYGDFSEDFLDWFFSAQDENEVKKSLESRAKHKEHMKDYRESHKEQIEEYRKRWHATDKYKTWYRQYLEETKEERAAWNREYYQKNKPRFNERRKQSYYRNREKILEQKRKKRQESISHETR